MDTNGTFHAKMGSMKNRNGMDLTEAEEIKRDHNNTQKNSTKKVLMSQITMMMWLLTYSQTSYSLKSSGL